MIRLIAAIDKKRGLAKDGQIPWNLPKDKARFRQLTLTYGANVLMGRTTYESMSDYLIGRSSYVVSHSDIKLPTGINLVKDLDDFMNNFKQDIWVIGGAGIYGSTIKYADELYLTLIGKDFKCDQFFPDFSDFRNIESDGPYTENNLTFSYNLLRRF